MLYRPGDEPNDGLCPVCHMRLPKKARDRSEHIHNCRRKNMKRIASQQSSFDGSISVEYCFVCFR